jgi:hypothetical protein
MTPVDLCRMHLQPGLVTVKAIAAGSRLGQFLRFGNFLHYDGWWFICHGRPLELHFMSHLGSLQRAPQGCILK